MAEIAYWEAIRRAHDEELAHDRMVIAMGEDIGVAGGTYKATSGLYQKYGADRIIDTPISENSYTGIGIGASMAGMRPIIEIMSINFALLALDTLINAAAQRNRQQHRRRRRTRRQSPRRQKHIEKYAQQDKKFHVAAPFHQGGAAAGVFQTFGFVDHCQLKMARRIVHRNSPAFRQDQHQEG